MRIHLTKANIITICITIAAASLFVAWGLYLGRDKPVEPLVEQPPVELTEEELFELLQEYRKTTDDATTTGPLEVLD